MQEPSSSYPSAKYGWYMVVLLTIAYVFSFIDRYILGFLAEPIQKDLGITDTQMGLLLGPAFGIFYATMGLPLGLLADRKRRTWIVAAGAIVWSAATALTGLAKNFVHLFLARISVGIGEATLSPCAMSMISDSFPPERRGRPIGFYTTALSIGGGIAALLSAGVLSMTKTDVSLPLVGQVAPWQFTFILVGLPGIIMGLLFLTLREPPRQKIAHASSKEKSNLADMLRHVLSRWKIFGSFIGFVCLMMIVAYSHGFAALVYKRTWGWENDFYALVNGIVLLTAGPITVNFAGYLSDKLFRQGRKDAPLLILIAGAFVLVPTGILFPLMPNPWVAVAVMFINTVGIALASATGVTALLNITPDDIKGQTVAFYYMVASMCGLFLGPTAVGVFSDRVFGPENLNYAMAAVPLVFGLPVLALARYAHKAYMEEFHRIHGKETGPVTGDA